MKKNNKGLAPIIVALIVAVLAGGGYGIYKLTNNKSFDLAQDKQSTTNNQIVKEQADTKDWKTYRNDEYGFEFKYPSLISTRQEGEAVVLNHSIDYKHSSPCDFKGDALPLEKFSDFNISLTVSDKNLESAKQDNFVWNYEKFSAGSLNGLKGESGVEGCGFYTYLFAVSENKTLIVKRSYITEFNPIIADYQTYLNLPGVISPDQEEKYFNQILSTFRFTGISASQKDWKTYRLDSLGMEFNLLNSWEEINRESIDLPEGFDSPQFAFRKNGTSCIFAYALSDNNIFQQYKQTSFADRVYNNEGQYDSSWYLPVKLIPPGFSFLWQGRQPFKNEIRIIPDNTSNNNLVEKVVQSFLLFSEDYSIVPEKCDKEVSAMLGSVEHSKYESIVLNSGNRGLLFVVTPQLLYRENGSNETKKVMDFNATLYPEPAVYDDQIFYVTSGSLFSLDVVSKNILQVSLNLLPGDAVNDFYFYKDKMFFLAGKWCRDYLDKCDLALHEYDLVFKQDKVLAKNVKSRVIAGYNSSDSSIYMYYSEGDGGCFWASSEKYSFDTPSLVQVDKYGACDGDKNYKEENNRWRDFISGFSKTKKAKHILFDGGKLRVPETWADRLDSSAWTIRFAE